MKISKFVKNQVKLLKEFEKNFVKLNGPEIEYESEEIWYQIFSGVAAWQISTADMS